MTQPFTLARLFLKDVSFEAPQGAGAFTQPWKPEVRVDIEVLPEAPQGESCEVVLSVLVLARNGRETAFLVEVLQGGVFTFADGADVHRLLHTACAEALLAPAREVIDALVARAGFAAIDLGVVDFSARYARGMA